MGVEKELIAALAGDDWGDEYAPEYLQPVSWLQTLLKECRRPEVFALLAGDDPDACRDMLFICDQIVERGKAAISRASPLTAQNR